MFRGQWFSLVCNVVQWVSVGLRVTILKITMFSGYYFNLLSSWSLNVERPACTKFSKVLDLVALVNATGC